MAKQRTYPSDLSDARWALRQALSTGCRGTGHRPRRIRQRRLRTLLTQVASTHPTITKIWADSAYRTKVIESIATCGIDVEVVRRDPTSRGFTVPPRRWVVERTLGWPMLHRRLARDYEALPTRSEAMIHIPMIDLLARRLTGENTQPGEGLEGPDQLHGSGHVGRSPCLGGLGREPQ